MEKVFIGKVTEKTFNNGGSIIRLALSPDDKAKLAKEGWDNIDIKKSTKGNWYAEISQFQPQAQSQRSQGRAYQQTPAPVNSDIEQEQIDDLLF